MTAVMFFNAFSQLASNFNTNTFQINLKKKKISTSLFSVKDPEKTKIDIALLNNTATLLILKTCLVAALHCGLSRLLVRQIPCWNWAFVAHFDAE